MTWTPKRVASNTSPLISNLITYFRTNQTAAIAWACAAAGISAAPDIAYFYDTNAGSQDRVFPNVQFLNETEESDYGDGGNVISYPIDLLVELDYLMQDTDVLATQAGILRAQAKAYMRAIESMALEIPFATLMNGVANYTMPNISKTKKRLGLLMGTNKELGYVPIMQITWEFQQLES